MNKLVALFAGSLVAIAFSSCGTAQTGATTSPGSGPPTPSTTATASDLATAYKKSKADIENQSGAIYEITGTANNVLSAMSIVYLESGTQFETIQCDMSKKSEDYSSIKKGDTVKIIGTLESKSGVLKLKDCYFMGITTPGATPTSLAAPTPTPLPSIDTSTPDGKVQSAAFQNLASYNFEYVESEIIDPGLAVIRVKGTAFWDENHLMTNACLYCAKTVPLLFKLDGIDQVTIFYQAEMTDTRGNKNNEDVIKIIFDKDNAKTINFDNLPIASDYNSLLNLADEKYINPAIAKNLTK